MRNYKWIGKVVDLNTKKARPFLDIALAYSLERKAKALGLLNEYEEFTRGYYPRVNERLILSKWNRAAQEQLTP